jgi:peptidoglycan-N-acetylglucosamine deacetylase
MRRALPRFPSRMHAAAAVAVLAAGVLLAARPGSWLWPCPLLAWLVLAVGVAPYFPGWSFYFPVAAHGPRGRREIALTFDDGPDPRTLPRLLELLAALSIPAAFFVVGRRAAAHPEAIRAILAAGHELGNHSDTHDVFLATRTGARIRGEIEGCQRALEVHGVRPLAYRPPVGIVSPPLGKVLRELGMRCVAFSCRPLDFGNLRTRDLAGRVLRRVRAGDIVLLHDALPADGSTEGWLSEVASILAGLEEKGLRPVKLSELLGERVMEETTAAPGAGTAAAGGAAAAAGTDASTPSALVRLSSLLSLVFTVAYPLLVAGSLAFLGARSAALVLLGVHLLARLRTLRRDLEKARGLVLLAALVGVLLLLGAILDDPRYLLAYPSLVNAALLVHFAWSLRTVPVAERFARLEAKDPGQLDATALRYCRRVTIVWCAFFVLNGGIATALAIWAPRAVWAAYTGGISYLLVGLLFASEYVVRRSRFGRFGPGPVDRVLARLLARSEPPP